MMAKIKSVAVMLCFRKHLSGGKWKQHGYKLIHEKLLKQGLAQVKHSVLLIIH